MIPIISIVGTSGSGKTTLLEKIIKQLTAKGYNVATIKHDAHNFEIDRKGKDSYRFKQAGSRTVIIASSEKVALIKDVEKENTLDELLSMIPFDTDIIITEGYKQSDKPKIEVFRKNNSKDLIFDNDESIVAIATDDINSMEHIDINYKLDLNDPESIGDFIEKHYIRGK